MTETFDNHTQLNSLLHHLTKGFWGKEKLSTNYSEVSHDNVPTLVARTCDVTVVKG
jgi:hypothetical protein